MNSENFPIHDKPNVFFSWLKKTSEKVWESVEIKQDIFGFQIQKGMKWLEGLSEPEIEEFESELGFSFPEIYKFYLRNMNGTDQPGKNIYGKGKMIAYSPVFYSFPRDLEKVKDYIKWIYESFAVDEEDVRREKIPHIIPITGHRFLIADNCAENPVLSMYGIDTIPYAPSLQSFLIADIFEKQSDFIPDYEVKFWLNGFIRSWDNESEFVN